MIQHHLADALKTQYLQEQNPRKLWDNLKLRFDHMKLISLPATRHDWIHLRVQDFRSVAEYNNKFVRTVSQLDVCGQPVNDTKQTDKTLSTFHAANIVLLARYWNMKFTRYSKLLAHM
jgi:hypothetical protein